MQKSLSCLAGKTIHWKRLMQCLGLLQKTLQKRFQWTSSCNGFPVHVDSYMYSFRSVFWAFRATIAWRNFCKRPWKAMVWKACLPAHFHGVIFLLACFSCFELFFAVWGTCFDGFLLLSGCFRFLLLSQGLFVLSLKNQGLLSLLCLFVLEGLFLLFFQFLFFHALFFAFLF